jgi:CBS domain-containing protein
MPRTITWATLEASTQEAAMKVKDVMTSDVVSVRPETSLKEVARLLVERRISGVPVVAEDGTVVGVVSEGDILFKERGPSKSGRTLSWLMDASYKNEAQLKFEAQTAAEAMTTPAKTIPRWHSISGAAAQMIEGGVNRLPVVDNRGKLVGIVTRADLVRAFVRPDAEIEQEIRTELLVETLWLRVPERVAVSVDSGKVTLGGTVDTRSEAELITVLATKIPGVVEVESEVNWLQEDGRRRS